MPLKAHGVSGSGSLSEEAPPISHGDEHGHDGQGIRRGSGDAFGLVFCVSLRSLMMSCGVGIKQALGDDATY